MKKAKWIVWVVVALSLLLCALLVACNKDTDDHVHTFGEWAVDKEATCKEEGVEKRVCTICGLDEIRAIPVLPHSVAEWQVLEAATCTTNGSRTGVCTECGDTVNETVNSLGHDFSTEWSKDALGHWHSCQRAGCDATKDFAYHDFHELSCKQCSQPTEEYIYTDLPDGSVELTRYNGDATTVSINEIYNGKTVSAIGARAFYNRTALESVTLPLSVTKLGEYAFFNCSSLQSFVADGITEAGAGAFSGTKLLDDAKEEQFFAIGHVLYKVNELYATDGTSLMPKILEIDGITVIAEGAFSGCTHVKAVVLPSGLAHICNNAFAGAVGLGKVYAYGAFDDIDIGDGNEALSSATLYMFSADYPFNETVQTGNFWYLDEGTVTEWKKTE